MNRFVACDDRGGLVVWRPALVVEPAVEDDDAPQIRVDVALAAEADDADDFDALRREFEESRRAAAEDRRRRARIGRKRSRAAAAPARRRRRAAGDGSWCVICSFCNGCVLFALFSLGGFVISVGWRRPPRDPCVWLCVFFCYSVKTSLRRAFRGCLGFARFCPPDD